MYGRLVMVKSEENRAMYEAFDETEEDFENFHKQNTSSEEADEDED